MIESRLRSRFLVGLICLALALMLAACDSLVPLSESQLSASGEKGSQGSDKNSSGSGGSSTSGGGASLGSYDYPFKCSQTKKSHTAPIPRGNCESQYKYYARVFGCNDIGNMYVACKNLYTCLGKNADFCKSYKGT